MNKRGISVWVSWILLVAFIITISALMFSWITSFTEQKSSELRERVNDISECSSVSINIDSVCQDVSTSHFIYVNISNNGNIAVDKFIFRTVDLHESIVESKEKLFELRPGESERVKLLKQGTIKYFEAIPLVFKDDYEILCSDRMASNDIIGEC
jgi:archaellum component FlaF (FlaF/FlaG flagellin family)